MKVSQLAKCLVSLSGFCLLVSFSPSVARADFIFGEPVNVMSTIPSLDPVQYDDMIECFSYDGLELYFCSLRPGGQGDYDLWVLKRTSPDQDWGPPENLGPAVNSVKEDSLSCISADGLTLYFSSNRVGADYDYDIYMTTRTTKDAPWSAAVSLGSVVNSYNHTDAEPWISPDGLELYFESYRPGGYGFSDIYVTRRSTVNDTWGVPVNLGSVVNSSCYEQFLSLSPDGLLLLFGETRDAPWRSGGYGGADVWISRRASLSDPWQTPANAGPNVNTSDRDNIPRISPDGRLLYFCSHWTGQWENYQAPIIPIVDFTGDGYVDGQDLLAMIAQFGQSDALCDIGPYAWGDGVVDVQDVVALAPYIGAEVSDPTLIAHWALDETDGLSALDSAGGHHAFVVAGATWRPDEGQVGGALEFDGIDDCVVTGDSVTNDLDSCFTVIAWIRGGAPNQAIISQGDGGDWLFTDPLDGCLATDLSGTARTQTPLVSDAVVTDGTWHRVGLVWDGASRILYMDGQEVAREALPEVDLDGTAMLMGAGAELQTGRFWCGLIDDVRVYSRVARP